MSKRVHRTKKTLGKRLRSVFRKRFRPVLHDFKWPLIALIWVISIVLGYIGYFFYVIQTGEDVTRLDLLYRSVQLIALESGDMEGFIPWPLEIARFLMPALAAYAAIQAILSIFSQQWQLFRVRFFKNHVVVCGLGERGLRLVREFSSDGYRIVVIEENKENPQIDLCRKIGAVILTGDATNRDLLFRAKVQTAKYLVAVCPDDGTNAEIALKARDIVRERKGHDLTVFVHIVDLELCNLLKGWELAAEAPSFRLEFFNVFERGAHLMLRSFAPDQMNTEAQAGRPRMLIVGLGKMGRSLLVQAARDWFMNRDKSPSKLEITVIDKVAKSKMELLRIQYPRLDDVCVFNVLQMDANAPDFERGDFLFDKSGNCRVDVIYICFDDDVHVLVSALTLFRRVKKYRVPVVARMNQDAGLATLINEERDSLDLARIFTFGLLDRTCNLEALLGGTHEIIARAIHEDYVRHQREARQTTILNPSLVEWDDLPEDLKESNRHQAAHIETKMKAIGCGIRPMTNWEAASFTFKPEEIEQLAKLEHERWCAERRRQGWSYTPGPKDIHKNISPHLISWDELPEEIREHDRNMVRGLPSFLAQAGFHIYRKS